MALILYNTAILKFKCHKDKYGHLIPIEAFAEIPFGIKRVYYIFGVDNDVRRGFHSHKQLQQALICINGSVKILI